MRTEIGHRREVLASYIEATYHLSSPEVVELPRPLLMPRRRCPNVLPGERLGSFGRSQKFPSRDVPARSRTMADGGCRAHTAHSLFDDAPR